MKYKNIELYKYMNYINEALPTATGLVGYALAHNYRVLKDTVDEFTQKRSDIITEYGEKDENGNYSVTDPDNIKKATDEINRYGDLTVEADLMKLNETDFLNCGLTALHIVRLQEFMMNVPEGEKKSVMMKDEDSDKFGI